MYGSFWPAYVAAFEYIQTEHETWPTIRQFNGQCYNEVANPAKLPF